MVASAPRGLTSTARCRAQPSARPTARRAAAPRTAGNTMETLQQARQPGHGRARVSGVSGSGACPGRGPLRRKGIRRHVVWSGLVCRRLVSPVELELAQNRPEEAAARARQALRLSQRIGDRQLSVYVLAFLARAAAENGDVYRAGRLWGAIEAEEARRPLGAWKDDRDQYAARVLAHADAHLEQACERGESCPCKRQSRKRSATAIRRDGARARSPQVSSAR